MQAAISDIYDKVHSILPASDSTSTAASSGGTVPSSASATGTTGQMVSDSSYLYVCTASNTWKRVALATW
jgi:hypothetical protein